MELVSNTKSKAVMKVGEDTYEVAFKDLKGHEDVTTVEATDDYTIREEKGMVTITTPVGGFMFDFFKMLKESVIKPVPMKKSKKVHTPMIEATVSAY